MKDFHKKPFDEGTQVKLEFFKLYTQEWLPVFASQPRCRLTIVDFFAGPGCDSKGQPGSPLVLLEQVRSYSTAIQSNKIGVRLIFNEAVRRKARSLEEVLSAAKIPGGLCKWQIFNLGFEAEFEKLYPTLRSGPNLIFLDQQGVKFISDEVFRKITRLRRTDFMFFIASSFLRRFSQHPHIKKHLRIPTGSITSRTFNDTHRAVADHYRSLVSPKAFIYLGQFSIKKERNIYGLIFGSPHPLGMQKFLRVCWAADRERGEANFDIDAEGLDPTTPHLWSEMDQPNKVVIFQRGLEAKIRGGDLQSDRAVYVDCLQQGMLPKHGREVLRKLIKRREIKVQGNRQPRVSLKGYNDPRALEILENGSV